MGSLEIKTWIFGLLQSNINQFTNNTSIMEHFNFFYPF